MPLSQKQIEYLGIAWRCFETEPKIDYDKFREVAGLKSAASARELLRVTKKKLHEEYGTVIGSPSKNKDSGEAGPSPVKKSTTTATPRGRKRTNLAMQSDLEDELHDDGLAAMYTPTPKKKARMTKATPEQQRGKKPRRASSPEEERVDEKLVDAGGSKIKTEPPPEGTWSFRNADAKSKENEENEEEETTVYEFDLK